MCTNRQPRVYAFAGGNSLEVDKGQDSTHLDLCRFGTIERMSKRTPLYLGRSHVQCPTYYGVDRGDHTMLFPTFTRQETNSRSCLYKARCAHEPDMLRQSEHCDVAVGMEQNQHHVPR